MTATSRKGFTIIELLVVVSIIALLVGILLPAVGKARDQAKVSISLANLRNIGTAHASYGAAWNDRQYTAVVDTIASYGVGLSAFDTYAEMNGSEVYAALRDINPKIRAILVSGYSVDREARTMLDNGVRRFLQKPFRRSSLAQAVADALAD
jgi:prepilin-type N-terminal cleavage/methylation domain-containing protein